jgi:murein DD-endopeptidase MepM/ murein hydrolase activator NlpD
MGPAGLAIALGTLAACSEPPRPSPTPAETAAAALPPAPPPAAPNVFEGKLKPGQTLSAVLQSYNLPEGTTFEVIAALRTMVDMRRLRVGNDYRLELTDTGDFKSFSYNLSREQRYRVVAAEGGMKAEQEEVDVESRPYVVQGTIKSTLYAAVLDQGESMQFAMGLLDAFQWDINFYTDVQVGDRFQALVEKVFVDGKPARFGRVLYARYEGKTAGVKEAVAYRGDFFDAKGHYLQKSFLTTPLNVLKITSRFGQRFHPMTGARHAHKGMDYGAVTGTPVWSVADGRVLFAGNRNDGYGNQVLIEHSPSYVSRYAHLSRVSLAPGQRVKQKMKVGEVGSTGLSTGPHLHFEILINGKQVDPSRQKMMPQIARTVKDLPAFLGERERLLELMKSTPVASRETVAEAPADAAAVLEAGDADAPEAPAAN